MYLYRCAKRGDFDKNCPQVPVINGNNTHQYEDRVEYVHFFRYAKDAEYYFRKNHEYIKNSNYHVGYMVIDVDENEITKYICYRIYVIGPIFLENDKNLYRPILEYAIPKALYDSYCKKYFFKAKEEYSENVNSKELFYDRIPDEFRNDDEYEKYLNLINELSIKYNGNAELIGEEILLAYQPYSRK